MGNHGNRLPACGIRTPGGLLDKMLRIRYVSAT